MKESIFSFLSLIRKELFLYGKEFVSRFIDIAITLSTTVIVFGYFLSQVGLSKDYGAFILIGSIATFGFFDVMTRATILAQDITDGKISNLMILPLSSGLVLVAIAISWAICSFFLSILLIPVGKILLFSQFIFSEVHWLKFFLIMMISQLLYGFMALWLGSLVGQLRNSSWLWYRVINPLYIFCGFYYSWAAINQFSWVLGSLHFLNPLLYVVEGTRAASLGQNGYLPFYFCLLMLLFFTLIFGWDGVRRLKKRLDTV